MPGLSEKILNQQKNKIPKDQLDWLHKLERGLNESSLSELIKLLESDKVDKLTAGQIEDLGSYKGATVEGEEFFYKPFSRGNEPGKIIELAKKIGKEEVLRDLKALRDGLII